MKPDRRQLLAFGAAVLAGAALAPGFKLIELAKARSPDEAASMLQRWGLLIDTTKCQDCDLRQARCPRNVPRCRHGQPHLSLPAVV